MAKQHQFLLAESLTDGQIVIYLNDLIIQGYSIISWQIIKYINSSFHDVIVEVQ